jgi:hypothetical protein
VAARAVSGFTFDADVAEDEHPAAAPTMSAVTSAVPIFAVVGLIKQRRKSLTTPAL